MIQKALVAVIAAGALAVPLAGVAGAEPNPDGNVPCGCPDNPGMPGTENMVGLPPGYWSRAFAVSKDNSEQPSMKKVFGEFGYTSPGDFINDGAPPKQGTAPDAADQPTAP